MVCFKFYLLVVSHGYFLNLVLEIIIFLIAPDSFIHPYLESVIQQLIPRSS